MNILKTGLTAVILSVSLLYAADTINEQIQAIQKAPIQERSEMMNKLKIQIASMNEENRANAIKTLGASMGSKVTSTKTSENSLQRIQQLQLTQQNTPMQRSSTQINTQNNIKINTQVQRMGR